MNFFDGVSLRLLTILYGSFAEQVTLNRDRKNGHATESAADQKNEFDFVGWFGGLANSPAAARLLKRAISGRRTY